MPTEVVQDRWEGFELMGCVDRVVWVHVPVADAMENLRRHESSVKEGGAWDDLGLSRNLVLIRAGHVVGF